MFRWVLVLLLSIAVLPLAIRAAAGPAEPLAAASVDWPSYNNDIQSSRYVNIPTINRSNVSGLHVLCSAALGTPTSFQSGPIVVAGVLYVTLSTQTIALNATTCKKLWVNTYPHGGVTNRGAAYAGGLVYRGFGDGHVIAINTANGATVWNTSVIASGSFEFISAAPIVWRTLLIIGTANGDAGQLCHVLALDQKTGKLVWSGQTVPNPGSTLAKTTWQGATHIAGGATWTSFTVDPATGALYAPVGNPGPDYDIRERLGTNLYTNSVLEIDAATGVLLRSMQLVPQDAHDWDQAATPAVVTLTSGTKIALVAGKDGYLRSIDLHTFAQHWKRAVTSISNATAPIVTTGTHFCPGGGVFWNGPAYSPATGLAYVNAVDWCRTVYLEPKPVPYVPGKGWFGSSNVVKDAANSGWLSAINATTGAVIWNYHSTLPLLAGVTPTSGGLVFTADLLGNVLAFNASSGALLRKVGTGLPVGAGVISYAVAGKQYVAVAAGMYNTGFPTAKVNPTILVLGI